MSDSVSADSIELFDANQFHGTKVQSNTLSYKRVGYQTPFQFKNQQLKQVLEQVSEKLKKN